MLYNKYPGFILFVAKKSLPGRLRKSAFENLIIFLSRIFLWNFEFKKGYENKFLNNYEENLPDSEREFF